MHRSEQIVALLLINVILSTVELITRVWMQLVSFVQRLRQGLATGETVDVRGNTYEAAP